MKISQWVVSECLTANSLADNELCSAKKSKEKIPAPLFDPSCNGTKDPNSFLRVLSCCRLSREHEGICTLPHYICYICNFCSGWRWVLYHGLQKMGGNNNRLASLSTSHHNVFLHWWHILQRYLCTCNERFSCWDTVSYHSWPLEAARVYKNGLILQKCMLVHKIWDLATPHTSKRYQRSIYKYFSHLFSIHPLQYLRTGSNSYRHSWKHMTKADKNWFMSQKFDIGGGLGLIR